MTTCSGLRLREAQSVSRSLSALATVMGGLVKGEKHIPYRNSNLTFLLQDVLADESRCRVLLFVNINPIPDFLHEV